MTEQNLPTNEEQALAMQVYFVTENDQIKDTGTHENQSLPSWIANEVITSFDGKLTLHIYEGYHVPMFIQAIQFNTPELLVWSHATTLENQIGGEWYVNNLQFYYVRERTVEEQINQKFNWIQIEKELNKQDAVEEDGNFYKKLYIGTVMNIAPSGKYYTAWTSNQTEEDVDKDTEFFEALDYMLQQKGMWLESGEGSATDIFFCKNVDNPNVCPVCKVNELGAEGSNALSRKDNETEICSDCGRQEALDSFKF